MDCVTVTTSLFRSFRPLPFRRFPLCHDASGFHRVLQCFTVHEPSAERELIPDRPRLTLRVSYDHGSFACLFCFLDLSNRVTMTAHAIVSGKLLRRG